MKEEFHPDLGYLFLTQVGSGAFFGFLNNINQSELLLRLDKIKTLQVNADYQNDKDQAVPKRKKKRPQDCPKRCINTVLFLFCQKEKRKPKPAVPKNSTQYLSKAIKRRLN